MIKPAFSTVACREWTLERVAASAAEYGFDAVELRSEGYGGRQFACEPCLTDPDRTRLMFEDAGVEFACLATGLRFDEPVRPPVIGFALTDTEREVRRARRAIELAAHMGCRLVRVFAFEPRAGEGRATAMRRIVEQLDLVVAGARNTGVRIAIENAGAFPRASELVEVLDAINSPLLVASYSAAVAHHEGENPVEGVRLLGERLGIARIKDYHHERPCPLGQGEVPCRAFVEALGAAGYEGALVFEWDRAWIDGLADPEHVLPAAARTMVEWIGAPERRRPAPVRA